MFTPKTYSDKRIAAIQRRNMTQGTFVMKQGQYLLVLSLVFITITQFACAKPVPVHSSLEYMDMA